MLSYRHAFHAGNHADVLKHVVLVQLLRYLAQKDKPLCFIDTHAGAAAYALDEGYATKNAEYETGIARLWTRDDLPQPWPITSRRCARSTRMARCAAIPARRNWRMQLLREQDRLRLFELHSTESRRAAAIISATQAPRVMVQAGDGFAGLQSVLPPPSRRALVLIDPSYEDKSDYRRVLAALRDALKRFPAGCICALVSAGAAARIAAVSATAEGTAGQGLAARHADGEEAGGGRARPARQRHVRDLNPPWLLPQGAGAGAALSGASAGAGCGCGLQPGVRVGVGGQRLGIDPTAAVRLPHCFGAVHLAERGPIAHW